MKYEHNFDGKKGNAGILVAPCRNNPNLLQIEVRTFDDKRIEAYKILRKEDVLKLGEMMVAWAKTL